MSQADFGRYLECSLTLAEDLVNTYDPISGEDELTGVPALIDFVRAHEVSNPGKATTADVTRVRDLRTKLRSVFDASDQENAVKILNGLLSESGARPELTNHDGEPLHLHYSPPGTPLAPRLTAETAMALTVVIAEDGFDRLRICEGERCEDVFVDESRNRSRRYCSPAVCGNRASVAAWRARRRAEH
jgi:predicted RNA-binding Zn ribbon-like protein